MMAISIFGWTIPLTIPFYTENPDLRLSFPWHVHEQRCSNREQIVILIQILQVTSVLFIVSFYSAVFAV